MAAVIASSPASTRPAPSEPPSPAGALFDIWAAAADTAAATLAVESSAAGLLSGGLTVLWANRAAHQLLGVVVGQSVEPSGLGTDFFAFDGTAPWFSRLGDLVGGGELPRVEDPVEDVWEAVALDSPDPTEGLGQLTVRRLDDTRFLVRVRRISSGEVLAEQARLESEHRFRALAEHAPIGIIVSEAGTRLGYVNRCFAEITGWSPDDLLGTRWLSCIHPEDLPVLLTELDAVLAGEQIETRVRLLSVTDAPRWVQIRLSPVATPRRASGFIGTIEDVTARRAWEAQLTYQASHDTLTGLVNRRSLMENLDGLLDGRRQRDRDAAVLFCDLDGFKQINDNYGHDAGDRVLVEVAQRLLRTARSYDLVARMAGDEFVVLVTRIRGQADAQRAADRLIAALARPFRVGGQALDVSVSVGIAMLSGFTSSAELLQAADRGMYEAKRTGPGLWRHASAGEGGRR